MVRYFPACVDARTSDNNACHLSCCERRAREINLKNRRQLDKTESHIERVGCHVECINADNRGMFPEVFEGAKNVYVNIDDGVLLFNTWCSVKIVWGTNGVSISCKISCIN